MTERLVELAHRLGKQKFLLEMTSKFGYPDVKKEEANQEYAKRLREFLVEVEWLRANPSS